MGEVYRARDTRLSRDVALKVLPASVITDPDRRRRFRQEALAAGALSHPNIVAIYDVNLDGDVPYIVSELVDGQPLGRAIAGRPMPVRRVLEVAVQIADGMAAAHKAGIVHRDLKPDNILVTRDGRVKILDFGLAKTLATPGTDERAESTMTLSGVVLGTVHYMSPEQASGKELDARSDIFSFGLILYEMVTGTRPFARSSAVQTLAAIIGEEHPPIATPIPNTLRFTIDRCLVKDAAYRYASTLDLFESLRHQRDGLNESQMATASRTATALRPALRRWRQHLRPYLAPAGCLIGGALFAALWMDSPAPVSEAFRYVPLATGAEPEDRVMWSPDGEQIVYQAAVNRVPQLFVRSLSSPTASMVTRGTEASESPEWSGDGGRIFFKHRRGIYSVGAAGGEPQKVIDNAMLFAVAPGGKAIAFMRRISDPPGVSVWISSPPGAEPVRYPAGPLEGSDYAGGANLAFSPDGRKILYWSMMTAPGRGSEFWVLLYPAGKLRPVLRSLAEAYPVRGFTWLRDSRHVVLAATVPPEVYRSHLYIADTEKDTFRPLLGGIGAEANPSLSPDGSRLAYTAMDHDFDIGEFGLDGSPMRKLIATHRLEHSPAWSPKNEEYAYVTDRTGVDEIWIRTPGRDRDQPVVTPKLFRDNRVKFLISPAFSPDGERLAFVRLGQPTGASRDVTEIWTVPVSGGIPVRLTTAKGSQWAPTWSPDGAWIAFSTEGPPAGLMKARVGSDGRAEMLHPTPGLYPFSTPDWSPTGDVIAFHTREGTLLLSPDGQKKRVLRKPSLAASAWSRDGKTLYGFTAADGRQTIVEINVATGAERLISVMPQDYRVRAILSPALRISLSPDGKSLATSIGVISGDLWQLENFLPPMKWWRRSFF